MTPRTLHLDFRADGHGRWLEIALLAVALASGARLLTVYMDTREQIEQLEARKSAGARSEPARATTRALSEATLREADRINDVIDALTVPWDKLFRAVETTHRERVALLSLMPDRRAGTVQVVGEAADPGAMFDYIDHLQRQPALTDVYLLTQKFEERDPQHLIRFTLSASWLEHESK